MRSSSSGGHAGLHFHLTSPSSSSSIVRVTHLVPSADPDPDKTIRLIDSPLLLLFYKIHYVAQQLCHTNHDDSVRYGVSVLMLLHFHSVLSFRYD